MDINDKLIAKNAAELKLLIDSSAYLSMHDVARHIGLHPLDLLENYPNIDYYFSSAMINELIRGHEGFNALGLFEKSLQDEGSFADEFKEANILYNAKDGSVKAATLNAISGVDHGQILLCQNHTELVLLTNDHRMIKNAAAVLDRRLMDFQNFLDLMVNTPNKKLQTIWKEVQDYHNTLGYKPPKTVRFIPDRKPGKLPPHFGD